MTTREIERRPLDMRCRALEPPSTKRDTVVQQCQEVITFVLATGQMVPEDPGTRSVDDSFQYYSIYCVDHRTENNAMFGQRDIKGNRVGVQRILAHQTPDAWLDPVEGGERDEGRTRSSDLHHSNLAFSFLFVVKDAGSLTVVDQEQNDRFERIGGTVLLKSEDDTYIDTTSNWALSDAAGVAESVSSPAVGSSGREATIGRAVWEPGLFDDWHGASQSGDNFADVSVIQLPVSHILSGGGAGNRVPPRVNTNKMVDPAIASSRIFSSNPASELGPDVQTVAVANQTDSRHVIYAYDTGDEMRNSFTCTAPVVFNGFCRPDTSAGTEAVDESTDGLTLTEAGWYLGIDATINWILGPADLATNRQQGFAVSREHLGGSWTEPTNDVDDIDYVSGVPDITAYYESGTTDASVLVFKLDTLNDPLNDALHALVAAWRQSGTGTDSSSLKMQLMEGWTSEPSSIGTERGTASATGGGNTNAEHSGLYLVLTESVADAITDYADMFARFTFTKATNRQMRVVGLSWVIDGAVAAAPLIVPRQQLTTVRL